MATEFRGIEVFGRQPRQSSDSNEPQKPRAPRTTRAPQKQGAKPAQPTQRTRRSQREPARRSRLGILAAGAGILTVIVTITGISVSMVGAYDAGILLAYLATGTSVVAVLCGVVAVLTSRGRAFGLLALVLGVLASPPVLTRLLDWASGLG